MDVRGLSDTIVKTGLCCYGSRQYRLFLCTSTFFPGTGDYEDSPEICNDREMECYCIWLEDMVNTGNICANAGYYEHLPDAIRAAEDSAGFEGWVKDGNNDFPKKE